jgi:hypothetical protein
MAGSWEAKTVSGARKRAAAGRSRLRRIIVGHLGVEVYLSSEITSGNVSSVLLIHKEGRT